MGDCSLHTAVLILVSDLVLWLYLRSPKKMSKSYPPAPVTVILFGTRIFTADQDEVTRVSLIHYDHNLIKWRNLDMQRRTPSEAESRVCSNASPSQAKPKTPENLQ